MNNTKTKQISPVNIIENRMINDLYKFKLIHGTKNPACKWTDKKNHFKKTPTFNYGIPTGIVNNIFVLDLDFYTTAAVRNRCMRHQSECKAKRVN